MERMFALVSDPKSCMRRVVHVRLSTISSRHRALHRLDVVRPLGNEFVQTSAALGWTTRILSTTPQLDRIACILFLQSLLAMSVFAYMLGDVLRSARRSSHPCPAKMGNPASSQTRHQLDMPGQQILQRQTHQERGRADSSSKAQDGRGRMCTPCFIVTWIRSKQFVS